MEKYRVLNQNEKKSLFGSLHYFPDVKVLAELPGEILSSGPTNEEASQWKLWLRNIDKHESVAGKKRDLNL